MNKFYIGDIVTSPYANGAYFYIQDKAESFYQIISLRSRIVNWFGINGVDSYYILVTDMFRKSI